MVFYATPAQRAFRQPSHFWITPRSPLNNLPTPLPLDGPKDFTYLGFKLDSQMIMQTATTHTCQMIKWAYQTVSTIVHSLKHDTPTSLQGIRTSPLILHRIWQSYILSHVTQNLSTLPRCNKFKAPSSALCSAPCIVSRLRRSRCSS